MTDNRPGSPPVEEARLLSICDLERHVGFINHCLLLPVLCAPLLLLGKFNIRREATDRSLLLGKCAACDQSARGEEAGQASLPVPSPLLMWFLKGRAEKVTLINCRLEPWLTPLSVLLVTVRTCTYG